MAWIELHDTLPEHPKVYDLMAGGELSKLEAVGLLAALWCYAMKYGEDGTLKEKYWRSFCASVGRNAAETVRILCDSELTECDVTGNVTVKNWHKYAGRLEDYRAKNRERQRRHRERLKAANVSVTLDNSDVTPKKRESHTTVPTVPNQPTSPTKKKITPPAAWASELSRKIARHVLESFGRQASASDAERWAKSLERLTNAKSLVPKPSPSEVQEVVEWGLADNEARGSWQGWAHQIRSAPDVDKFVKVRSAMKQSRQTAPAFVEDVIDDLGDYDVA